MGDLVLIIIRMSVLCHLHCYAIKEKMHVKDRQRWFRVHEHLVSHFL